MKIKDRNPAAQKIAQRLGGNLGFGDGGEFQL
jgi:hypothetical protein